MPTGLLSHSITRGGRTQSWSQSLKSSTKTTNLALHYYSLLCTDEKPTANCNSRLVAAIPQISYPTRSSVQLGYQGGIESWIARTEWNANFGRSSIDPGDSKHMVIVASGLRKYKYFFRDCFALEFVGGSVCNYEPFPVECRDFLEQAFECI